MAATRFAWCHFLAIHWCVLLWSLHDSPSGKVLILAPFYSSKNWGTKRSRSPRPRSHILNPGLPNCLSGLYCCTFLLIKHLHTASHSLARDHKNSPSDKTYQSCQGPELSSNFSYHPNEKLLKMMRSLLSDLFSLPKNRSYEMATFSCAERAWNWGHKSIFLLTIILFQLSKGGGGSSVFKQQKNLSK